MHDRGKYTGSVVRHKRRLSAVVVWCPNCGRKWMALDENGWCRDCNLVADIEAKLKARTTTARRT